MRARLPDFGSQQITDYSVDRLVAVDLNARWPPYQE